MWDSLDLFHLQNHACLQVLSYLLGMRGINRQPSLEGEGSWNSNSKMIPRLRRPVGLCWRTTFLTSTVEIDSLYNGDEFNANTTHARFEDIKNDLGGRADWFDPVTLEGT